MTSCRSKSGSSVLISKAGQGKSHDNDTGHHFAMTNVTASPKLHIAEQAAENHI
jgi:hypothetical protein